MKESNVRKSYRLALYRAFKIAIWNNACGFNKEKKVTYGLEKGSADDIGITPILITKEMVGKTIGVFTSIEGKASNWKPPKSKPKESSKASTFDGYNHHLRQDLWKQKILAKFGIAGFARNDEEAINIISDYIKKLKS